jgi:hypothetical protein
MLGTRFDDRRQDTRLAVVVQRAISIERAMGFVKATRYLVERGATNELIERVLLHPTNRRLQGRRDNEPT